MILNAVLNSAKRNWRLTKRETVVLRGVLNGMTSTKELARYMDIADSTVGKHLQSITRKTALTGRIQVVSVLFRALCRALGSVSDASLGSEFPSVTVIGENFATSELLVEMLVENGFFAQFLPQTDGLSPDIFVNTRSDIVICDDVLTVREGIEVVHSLLSYEVKTPSVLLLTKYPRSYVDSVDEPIVSVVAKPVERNTLLREIWIAWMDSRIRNSLKESILVEETLPQTDEGRKVAG